MRKQSTRDLKWKEAKWHCWLQGLWEPVTIIKAKSLIRWPGEFFFSFHGISERQRGWGVSLQLLHCCECQAMTVSLMISFKNKRGIVGVNTPFPTGFGVFMIPLQDKQHSQWSSTLDLNFNSRKYKTKRSAFLRISRWPSLQTCVLAASSPVPSHQQTPATATSKLGLGQTAAHTHGNRQRAAQSEACLVDWRVPRCLPLGGGVQAPQGGKTAAAFAEGPWHGLVPLPDAALCASGHLSGRKWLKVNNTQVSLVCIPVITLKMITQVINKFPEKEEKVTHEHYSNTTHLALLTSILFLWPTSYPIEDTFGISGLILC